MSVRVGAGLAMGVGLALVSVLSVPPALALDHVCTIPDLGLSLAGAGAIDCGVARNDNERARRRVVACARKAIAKGKPVRFGTGFYDVDVMGCDVVVVDSARQYRLISLLWDFSLDMKVPRVYVGKCPVIDLAWEGPQGEGRFGPRDCTYDAEAFEVLKASH